MISIDALVLAASRDLPFFDTGREASLNSALAGAAYRLGFYLTEDTAREALEKLKKANKKAGRVR